MPVVENPDDRRVSARHRANDASFGAAIRTERGDLDQYLVAVHCRSGRGRRNEDIAGKPCLQVGIEGVGLRNHEAEAIAMHAEAPDEHVVVGRALRNRVAIGIDLQQFAFLDQGVQTVGQLPPAVCSDTQFTQQLFVARSLLGLAADVAK